MQRLKFSRILHPWTISTRTNPLHVSRNSWPVHKRHFHPNFDTRLEDQTLTLATGQVIGFAEYGSRTGTPLFLLHGNPGCRYDGLGLHDLGQKLNIRMIFPDRPGYGLSSMLLNDPKLLSTYAEDVSHLARHLGVYSTADRNARYHALGISGGGPYAISLANSEEVGNVAVMAGIGPPSVITPSIAGWYTYTVLFLLSHFPLFFGRLIKYCTSDSARLERQLDLLIRYFLKKHERARFTDPAVKAVILATIREAYRSGGDGVLRDAYIYTHQSSWDINCGDIRKRVLLFYGETDTRTPIAFGRAYKSMLGNAELTEFEGDGSGHFDMDGHDEEVLRRIVGSEGGRRP